MKCTQRETELELLGVHWKLVSAYRREDAGKIDELTQRYLEIERKLNRR